MKKLLLFSFGIVMAITLAACGGGGGGGLPFLPAATLTSIAVTPATTSIATGATRQFTATGTYSDSSTKDITASVTWDSSDGTRASVSAAGLATAASNAAGSATITATSGGVSGSAALKVIVNLPKTGQTISYGTGTIDDGALQKGVAWPDPRFTDNSDGTVTDNLTGLMWLKDANCINTQYPSFDNDGTAGDGRVTWQHALDFVASINAGTYQNCGGGQTGWRMPNRKELRSLVDYSKYNPALPVGQPFSNVQANYYWSSTTYAGDSAFAWYVLMVVGHVHNVIKTSYYDVWPVRSGQ